MPELPVAPYCTCGLKITHPLLLLILSRKPLQRKNRQLQPGVGFIEAQQSAVRQKCKI
jgi:hypothetical protein